ncbi:MAG: homocysteine S-methyltransferase family protein [Oscillospiraceae bacterium]|nr:homocysteine S-methyltransferase family protein [Oscillospiraceae bacterium]
MDRICLLDGAMGTELMKRGIPTPRFPEEVNLTSPEAVQAIHRDYVSAGSGILYACTFGANPVKAGSGPVEEVVRAAIRNARAAAGEKVRVALDVGPLGQLLEPYGDLTEEEAGEAFRTVFAAGREADLLVLETFFDLTELLIAVEAARETLPGMPVFATMTFQAGGRTLTGVTVEDMARELSAAGVSALGLNCSLGPAEALPLVQTLAEVCSIPLIAKPNAGMPDPKTGAYPMDAASFAQAMVPILDLGVRYAGGCCGTDPDYIRALAEVCS